MRLPPVAKRQSGSFWSGCCLRSRTSSTHVHSSHMHELVEIADQRGAMECIWHGRMELNQTYVNDKENNISDLDVGKFTGELTVGMMIDAGSPLAAQLLARTVVSILGAYLRQLAPIVSTLTWFATGKLKSIPQSILGEQRKPGWGSGANLAPWRKRA